MAKKIEEFVYTKSAILRAPIKITAATKKKDIKKLVEKEAVPNKFYSYSQTGRHEISLVIYQESDFEGVYETKPLLPVIEFLKTYSEIYAEGETCLFVLTKEKIICVVKNGVASKYVKVTRSNDDLINEVHAIEKSLTLEGRKYQLYFDSGLDCFSGEKIDLHDNLVIERLSLSQFIRVINKNNHSFLNSFFNVKNIVIISILFNFIFMVSLWYFYLNLSDKFLIKNKIFLDLKKEMVNLNKQQSYFSEKTRENNDKKNNDSVYNRIHPKDMKVINDTFSLLNDKLEKIQQNGLNSDNYKKNNNSVTERLDVNKLLKIKEPDSTDSISKYKKFDCKPLIVTKEKMVCRYEGSPITFTNKITNLGEYKLKYLSEKRQLFIDYGYKKEHIEIDMLGRGF